MKEEPECIACEYSPTDTAMYCYFGCPPCTCRPSEQTSLEAFLGKLLFKKRVRVKNWPKIRLGSDTT